MNNRGFTLTEMVVGVAIIGVLGVLANYGVRKYVANAKIAEARNSLGLIAQSAAAAYYRDSMGGAMLTPGSSAGQSQSLCGGASNSVPANKSSIQGRKYQSSVAEWKADAATNSGFACLRFVMDSPQYYQYSYTSGFATGNGQGNNGKGLGNNGASTFSAIANGDLNGDGVLSTFTLSGEVGGTGKANAALPGGAVIIAPNIMEVSPEE